MNKKMIVIGDSFATPQYYLQRYDPQKNFWCNLINDRCYNIDIYVNGDSSRDIQTIIDIWIKSLKYLNKNDYLIIILPYLSRTRLPLHSSLWHNSFNKDDIIHIERFCGTDSYINDNGILEFWGNKYNGDYFKKKLKTQELINASKSSQLNYNEIVESLKLLSPIKTFVMSWDEMDYKSEEIYDKVDMIKMLGMWETLNDDWINSKGEIGIEGDFHWGVLNMHKKVADFFIDYFDLLCNNKKNG